MTTRAMVFAAGLGTRLRPLTNVLPKPVVPIVNRPLSWFALDHLRRAGCEHVVLNTHHLASEVERALLSAPKLDGLALTFAEESRLLGTGGGVKNAVQVQSSALGRELGTNESMIAFNGDVFFAPNLEGAIELHERTGAIATMILRDVPDAMRFGAIEIDESGQVRRMLETPTGEFRACMFSGVHVLSSRAIAELPSEGCIVRQGYRRWLERGERISGFVDASPWRDLGTPHEYLNAHLDLLRHAVRREGFDVSTNAIEPSAEIHPSAHLIECSVGARAKVLAGVVLERCVVWPDTIVRTSARDSIIARDWVVDSAPDSRGR
jgi:mannose-1-phosphate guanylyltransferase